MKENKSGFCYIAINASMPNMLKIGKTTKHPLERVKELSAPTGIPTSFQVAYYQQTDDIDETERRMHDKFDSKRVTDNREFFHVSLFKAATFLDSLVNSPSKFDPPTPFAELFATFPDRGDGILNRNEIKKCSILAAKIRNR